jgi:hypothetical protein
MNEDDDLAIFPKNAVAIGKAEIERVGLEWDGETRIVKTDRGRVLQMLSKCGRYEWAIGEDAMFR